MLHSRHVEAQSQPDAYADAECQPRQTVLEPRLGKRALNLDAVCQRQAVFFFAIMQLLDFANQESE